MMYYEAPLSALFMAMALPFVLPPGDPWQDPFLRAFTTTGGASSNELQLVVVVGTAVTGVLAVQVRRNTVRGGRRSSRRRR